jgi:putative restriction endonuclease
MNWLEQTARLRQWSAGGVRAPHKPLLLLYALARFQQDPDGEPRYSAVERALADLLAEYGPGHRTSPAYPFHHLVNDGVWEVHTSHGPGSPGTGVRELRASGATGRLAESLRGSLRRDPSLLPRMARVLLDRHFPPSLHEDLCQAVGLAVDPAELAALPGAPGAPGSRRRDARMRELILTAYEYRCAFCGYDGRIGTVPVGLEAAHVRWWAFEGPDELGNGLGLCSLHHKLFDRGVLGLTDEDTVMVSQRFVTGSPAGRQVIDLAGRPLLGPQTGAERVHARHRAWHAEQVFHGLPRPRVPARP